MRISRTPGGHSFSPSRLHTRRALIRGTTMAGLAASLPPFARGAAGGQTATPAAATPAVPGSRSITRAEYLAAVRQHFSLAPPQVRGGHALSAHLAPHLTLNPAIAADTRSARVLENVFSALVRSSMIDGSWAPDLADFWEVSADGRTYTFHLNRDATWHDGRAVTAADCVFTLDAVLDQASLGGFQSRLEQVVEGYRALDDHTFELTGKQPVAILLDYSVGNLPILPRHIWEPIPLGEWGAAPGATGTDPSQVVGSGPFRFGEWSREGHVSIMRNDEYWVPELVPAIDTFTWRVLPESNAAVQALIAGEIDLCGVPAAQAAALQDDHPELVFTIYDENAWETYILNGNPDRMPHFVDARVRQAMLFGLDREALVETLLDGLGTPADGIYPPTSMAWDPERLTTIYRYDPDRARALLDEAGWIPGADGIRSKDGIRFRFELLFPDVGEIRRQTATYLQQAWGDVGIEMEATGIAFQILLQHLDEGDFDATLIGQSWSGDDQGDLYRCDAAPVQHICHPEFDRLNDASLVELDPVRRRELLIAQGNVVNAAATLGLLYFSKTVYASRPQVRNFFANTWSLAGCLPWIWLANEP